MLGSLIGIFLTSTGIIIGADAVLLGSTVPPPAQVDKTCQLGLRSAGTLQGWYGENLYLYQRFHEVCRELARSSKLQSLEAQADRLAKKLEQTYREHTGIQPPKAANLPPPSNEHVAYVAVAGYERETPLVTVREIRWRKNGRGNWHVTTERVSRLSAHGCGARFIGEDGVANVLLDKSAHFKEEKRRPEVLAGSLANQLYKDDDCLDSSFSIDEAKALYKIAVRLTIDHGEQFAIEAGAVGGRLRLLTIPPVGSINQEVIDPEQYVADRLAS